MKKLDTKTYKLHRLLDYTGVILLVLLLLLIWQLYRGPISMPFLKPYIIKALNHEDTQYQVTLDSVNLELVRSIKPLRIIANNVSYRKTDGELVVNAPKTSVSFSIKALLRGVIAPSSIEVIRPNVYIFTSYGVEVDKKEEANQKKLEYYFANFEAFLERFNSDDKSYPESYINDIDIKNAEVEFHEVDLGRKWVFSDLNYRFDRNFTNIETEVNTLLKFGENTSSVGLEAIYRPSSNKVALQFYFSDLVPANVVDSLSNQLAMPAFYNINLPLNGKIDALVNFDEVAKNRDNLINSLDSAVEKVQFSFEGGSGSISLANDKEGKQSYNISSLMLNGELSGGLDKVDIKNAEFDLDGQKAYLGFNVSGMKNYLLKASPNDLKVSLSASVAKVNMADLFRYWPPYVARQARDWCVESLLAGDISDGNFVFNFAYDKKSKTFGFQDMLGKANIADATLDYLTGMPKITNIYGSADFSIDKIKLYLDKGVSDDVILNNGYVELYDLDKYDNFARVNLQAVGSISDVLKLIDNKPLNYTSDMGINPNSIKGSANTDLNLEFELKENLGPDEVKVGVKSELQDVIISDMIKGKNIEAKKLDLSVTNEGLLIAGIASFEGIPINLLWDENFTQKNYKSKYKLTFNFDNNLKQKLGVDYSVLGDPFIVGSIPTEAIITSFENNKTTIDITGNLRDSNIDYSFLGFKKLVGTNGTIKASILFDKSQIKSIPSFSLSKPEFNLNGKISFDNKGQVKLVDISNIKGPKTSARAQIEMSNAPKPKVKINVFGDSYNLSDFFAKDENEIKDAKERRKQLKIKDLSTPDVEEDELEKVADTEINIAVNSLWTNENIAIRNFAGTTKLVNGVGIYEMHMIGNFGSNRKGNRQSNLKLDYVPRANKEFLLNVESNDAGSTMKFLRLYDNMSGGNLSINAKRGRDKRFVGHAKVRDCNIYNTPILTKLLTVASFTGIVNLLTGEGIVFSHFDAPFEYHNKMLTIQDAKAFGNVMGITVKGTYYSKYQEYNIKGLIAPAYGLNTFIGRIPVVGNLLSGKDGTVFAANYSITGDVDDPIININPLSALSPNSLKEKLSSIFGSEDAQK